MGYSALFIAKFGGDAVQKLFEGDLPALGLEGGDHVEDGGVFALEAETLHGGFKLSGVYFAGGFGVEEVEGLSEFLNFIFGESWSLDFVLGGSLGSVPSFHQS